ncbi:opine dehydrogenase [Oscillibacter sp. PC13]|uniref:NAD/NADP-dependent octopine/nopaline dehydrogenase family protein n=1 Tax=Oscillibacter sp. PC13 TaxID=1855299 RepID=UPI0008E76803|nr:NAD/NADP-dependent octopine/nopaline dehydrogenase family protein [Oscillibacter sp. PC13]SFP97034.1 opine dehydrogenase [Oscillibacter sp. PC13]
MEKFKFAVIGAGASGTLMSIILKTKGYSVNLMDKDTAKVETLKKLEVLKATGKTEAQAKPDLITADTAACINGANIIMVCTTTDAHGDVAHAIADTVQEDQIIILNPGHLGGVLNFRNALMEANCKVNPLICEASDMMFACRTMEIGHTFHSGVKAKIKLASIPAENAKKVADLLKDVFPCYVPASNVLETGLSGGSGMLHSIPCVMNINKIELQQPFDYYIEGLTPGVCKVIEAADKERIAVCTALGVTVEPLLPHLKSVYGLEPDNLYDAIQSCVPYKGIKSPMNTNHRFMQEDTLCDLVPTASIGKMLGVATPTIDMIIALESLLLGKDFAKEGRTVEKLGLAGKSKEEIFEMVQ